MRSTKLWLVVKGGIAIHLLLAVIAWFMLPPRIPTHFGLGGKPDAWSETSLLGWFMLVAISAGLSAMVYLTTSPGAKTMWNIGEKKRFLALTPEQQVPIFELIRIFGACAALCVNIVFLTLQLGLYLAAQGHTKGLPWWTNIVLFGAPFCLVVGIVPWDRAVRREVLKASGSTP